MSNAVCMWREEEVIDYTLGKLTPEQGQLFAKHLPHCPGCQAVYREWAPLLVPEREREQLCPSPIVKKRLLRRIRFVNLLHRLSNRFRPVLYIPALATAALFLLLLHGSQGETTVAAPELPAKAEWLTEHAMMNDPQTELHEAIPVINRNAKGYVWINDSSQEMLFLACGLDQLAEKDYQVWFVKNHNRSNGGLLQWKGNMAHLYFHGGNVRQIENIAVSIEPKGGSFAPTGPDTMVIPIRHVKY